MWTWSKNAAVLVVLVVIAAVAQSVGDLWVQSILMIGTVSCVVVVSLTVLTGWAGQPSLAPAGIMLAGGYCAVLVPAHLESSFLLAALLAMIVGGVIGTITAFPSLRIAGTYVLLGTLAVQQLINDAGSQLEASTGATGGYILRSPNIFGYQLVSITQWMWAAVILLILVSSYFFYLRGTRIGRSVRIIKTGKGISDVAGISSARHLIAMFAATGALMALAGLLISYVNGNISYAGYDLNASLQYFVMAVIGGLGWIPGAIIGAFVVTGIPSIISRLLPYSTSGGLGALTPYIQGGAFAILGFFGVYLTAKRELGQLSSFGRGLPRVWKSAWSRGSSSGPSQAVVADQAVAPEFDRGGTKTLIATDTQAPVPSGGVSDMRGASGTLHNLDTAPLQGPAVLELRDVCAAYGPIKALTDINLKLGSDQIIAVLGRNGAGKSTLLKCIAGFSKGSTGKVVRGEVILNDKRIKPRPDRSRDHGIWFMSGERKIFESLTVKEHIRLANRLESLEEAMDETVETFPALGQLVRTPAGHLSGGERQMLALACAFVARPSVVLIDELSQGLSPAATDRAMEALVELQKRLGVAVLLVEQMVGLAFDVADHVILMESGRFVREGAATESFEEWTENYLLGGLLT